MFLFADLSARKQLRVPMYAHICLSLLAHPLRHRYIYYPNLPGISLSYLYVYFVLSISVSVSSSFQIVSLSCLLVAA